jgi:hypothetical protein
MGNQPSLSKARHWAQRALEAAPDVKAKTQAAKLLADVQEKLAQFSEDAWAAMLQTHWGCLTNSDVGEGADHVMRLAVCVLCLAVCV